MAKDCRTCKYNGTDDNKCYWCFRHDTELNQRYSKWHPKDDVPDINVGEMTLISMDDALNVVRDTIAKAFENLPCHYDERIGDEVYDDIGKVNLLLEVNKEIRTNIKKLKERNG
jgi:hypothetical protein